MIVIVYIPWFVPVAVVPVINREKVVMIPVIVMVVVRSPWAPVFRVITPVPRRVPYRVAGVVYVPDNRPCSNLNVCSPDDLNFVAPVISGIPRVWRLIVDWLHYVIPSIECLVADKLYLH